MSFAALQAEVLDADLCAHCGLCEAVCPTEAIDCSDLQPRLRPDAADCLDCNLCVETCPGADPDTAASELSLFGRVRRADERWLGIVESIHSARSLDEETFRASGSGGSVTEMLHVALSSGEVDAVLVMSREQDRPWRAAPALCRDAGSLASYGQSTYQLAPHLRLLRDFLQGDRAARVAVVGLACHVQAIRKLQRHPSDIGARARDRIPFVVEIACSSSTLPSGTETFVREEFRIDPDQVTSVRYRDNGYPGEFAVETRSGSRHAAPVWKAIRHFKDHKTHRCLSCGDWLSGLADLSICDGDPNIFITSQASPAGNEKFGTVMVRTPAGAALVEAARGAGRLQLWAGQVATEIHLGLLRKRHRRCTYEAGGGAIPAGPIPGYRETLEVIDDDRFVAGVAEPGGA
jgi:coenzyme F420 hydrogenase subunit beta